MKARIVFKGGKGSGHHGHSGLSGVHGGSTTSSGSGGGVPHVMAKGPIYATMAKNSSDAGLYKKFSELVKQENRSKNDQLLFEAVRDELTSRGLKLQDFDSSGKSSSGKSASSDTGTDNFKRWSSNVENMKTKWSDVGLQDSDLTFISQERSAEIANKQPYASDYLDDLIMMTGTTRTPGPHIYITNKKIVMDELAEQTASWSKARQDKARRFVEQYWPFKD